jgi:hypothetical protein
MRSIPKTKPPPKPNKSLLTYGFLIKSPHIISSQIENKNEEEEEKEKEENKNDKEEEYDENNKKYDENENEVVLLCDPFLQERACVQEIRNIGWRVRSDWILESNRKVVGDIAMQIVLKRYIERTNSKNKYKKR